MQSKEKFSLLRSILKTLGLSPDAVDDIVERIVDLLTFSDEKSKDQIDYPYHIRDDFLSPSDHSFYPVLKHIVSDKTFISPNYPRCRGTRKYEE